MRVVLFVVVFVTIIFGCVYCSGCAQEFFWHTQLKQNEPQNFANTGYISDKGYYMAWKISWNMNTTGEVQLGPFWIYIDNLQIISRFNAVNFSAQVDKPILSSGIVTQTIDPCTFSATHPSLFYSYAFTCFNTTGWANVTQYNDCVPTIGDEDTKATITLDCPIECKRYVQLNISTSLQSYVTVLNITSGLNAYLNYTEDPWQCPTNGTGYSVIKAGSNIIHINNQTQIWLLFYGYESTSSTKDNVLIEWSVVPYNGSSTPQSTPVSDAPVNAPENVPINAPENNVPLVAPQGSVPYNTPEKNTPYNAPQPLSPHEAPNKVTAPYNTPLSDTATDAIYWVIGGVCLGLAIIIVVVVVVMRKKRRNQYLPLN